MSYSRVYKVEGIVLKRKNVGEVDRILTVFTKEYGKVRVIAKGIRRITSRRAGHVEVFSRVRLMLHRNRSLDIVTEAQVQDEYKQLREYLVLVNGAYFLCELVDRLLPEKQESQNVYVLLRQALVALDTNQYHDIVGLCEQFALTLLHTLGFLPSNKILPSEQIQPFIENIVERKINTYKFLGERL